MRYFNFLIKCMKHKFRFFLLPPDKKARILEKNRLSFFAGIMYLELKDYARAAHCFELAHSYRHLMLSYQKCGLYSKAIEIADLKKYYKQGALLCEKISNFKKAAYFYAFFKPLYAARLYKSENFLYEAGECYLKAYQPSSALECFTKCQNSEQKRAGLKQLEEFAAVLYLTKQHSDAFKLFVKLGDYYSALECAKKLQSAPLIKQMHLLIGHFEAENKNYLLAAKFTEPYDKKKALTYYYLAEATEDAVRLLVEEKNYDKAFNLCIHRNNLALAYQLATDYDIPLTAHLCSS